MNTVGSMHRAVSIRIWVATIAVAIFIIWILGPDTAGKTERSKNWAESKAGAVLEGLGWGPDEPIIVNLPMPDQPQRSES